LGRLIYDNNFTKIKNKCFFKIQKIILIFSKWRSHGSSEIERPRNILLPE